MGIGTMWGSLLRDGERTWSRLPWRSADDGEGSSSRSQAHRGLVARLRSAVTAAAFWLAIPLPFLYVPVLFSGLDGRSEYLLFGALLLAHVTALSLGHPYGTDGTDRPTGADRPEAAD
ncbi:hypothetical protein [Halorientalis salina]|uniref:hypothetical protein n=1 Tax=Halorientalis salina TaxID=2932266 RepID=UPI002022B5E0|nr:hypothetical protein [Halorientalis salina]